MSIRPSDPVSMSDTDLIFAMGGHAQSCSCLLCDEWRRRNLFNVPLVPKSDPARPTQTEN